MRAARTRRTTAAYITLLWVLLSVSLGLTQTTVCHADGLAHGQYALVNSQAELHGYSGITGVWSSTPLNGDLVSFAGSEHIGLAVTTTELNLFKPATDRWLDTSYLGTIEDFDVQGATALAWTDRACYGISTVWGSWREEEFYPLESVVGGGSASNFAVLWTDHRALAYNGATGQWVGRQLPAPAFDGIAIEGIGLVVTERVAFVFNMASNAWVPHSIQYPAGLSAFGSGNVALLWNIAQADAYSGTMGQWSHLAVTERLLGGTAAEDVALVWGEQRAYVYSSATGAWSTFEMIETMDAGNASGSAGNRPESRSTFQVGPNPGFASQLTWTLPGSQEAWDIEIYDLNGRILSRRSISQVAAGNGSQSFQWQPTDSHNADLPGGTYWVRATSGDRIESRRLVILP